MNPIKKHWRLALIIAACSFAPLIIHSRDSNVEHWGFNQTNAPAYVPFLKEDSSYWDGDFCLLPQLYVRGTNVVVNNQRVGLVRAKIHSEIVTNWQLTSVETPIRKNYDLVGITITTLEYHATGYHETGTITSNVVVEILWHGQWHGVQVESIVTGTETRTTWK